MTTPPHAGLTGLDLCVLFSRIAQVMENNREALCALDGAIGDGDHGVTMATGFRAIDTALADMGDDPGPADVFNLAARTFLNVVGASAGPLYATGFMRAALLCEGKANLTAADMAGVIAAMAEGIIHRGKAGPGEKTMVDAWNPAARAAQAGGDDLAAITARAAQAAQAGAQATIQMMPGKGRAANLGARAVGHIDPGAASAALIIEAIAGWAADKARPPLRPGA